MATQAPQKEGRFRKFLTQHTLRDVVRRLGPNYSYLQAAWRALGCMTSPAPAARLCQVRRQARGGQHPDDDDGGR